MLSRQYDTRQHTWNPVCYFSTLSRDNSLDNRNCLLSLPFILRMMSRDDDLAISFWIGV